MSDADARRRNHWVNHIGRHAHEKAGAVFLRLEGRSTTWAQLHERVSAVTAAMRRRGVGAGHRVAIMMTNRPEFLETMFAANALGAIAVPVNFRLAAEELAFILRDSGASLAGRPRCAGWSESCSGQTSAQRQRQGHENRSAREVRVLSRPARRFSSTG